MYTVEEPSSLARTNQKSKLVLAIHQTLDSILSSSGFHIPGSACELVFKLTVEAVYGVFHLAPSGPHPGVPHKILRRKNYANRQRAKLQLENRPGTLAKLRNGLAGRKVNIVAF